MKSKEKKQVKILCKRCNIETNHAVEWEKLIRWGNEDIQGEDRHQILLCKGCESVTYVVISTDSDSRDPYTGEFYESYKYYPNRRPGMISSVNEAWKIPQKVRGVYMETINAYNDKQSILCSMGVRCIVEAICLDKGIKKGNLELKINKLKGKGLITQLLSDGLHQIRFIGNDGAHDINASSEADLRIAMDLINNLIIECYLSPDKVSSLKARKSK
ncbi:DUF4145 domain-containing protein [Patescibacteria group bacterium]